MNKILPILLMIVVLGVSGGGLYYLSESIITSIFGAIIAFISVAVYGLSKGNKKQSSQDN
jgi:hypothetical protein